MNFSLPRHSAWLWLLCITLIVVRVSGAHWHLCHDGSEPPQTVHLWDGAIDDKTEPGHSDTNLNLVDHGLAKDFNKLLDMPALISVVLLLCVLISARREAPLLPYRAVCFPRSPYPPSAPPRAPPR